MANRAAWQEVLTEMLITNNFLPVGLPPSHTHFSYFAEFEVFIIISKFHVISFAKLGTPEQHEQVAIESGEWNWPTHSTIVLCVREGQAGSTLEYWILTVRENIAIKLNLLSSLIKLK